jgi:pyroglutamyl-peptidase
MRIAERTETRLISERSSFLVPRRKDIRPVLITGFEPFGGEARNPSQEIARALDGRVIAGRRIVGAVLPCVFGVSLRSLRMLVRQHNPSVVVCLGLANTRSEITPERVAINLDDARIRDNAGWQPVDRRVVRNGPAAYWSTLPVTPIVAALRKRGLPARPSETAGTFVCNHVFYGLMRQLHRKRTVRGGFIHVPWPQGWAPTASVITFEQMVAAIGLAIEVSFRK